ncbi:class I SAM-dependent methyltransferase [Microbacterium sp. ProA8]|uniref:class I SAM-dependent methyltransferase n=1 Tax=Microbacterium chionoecetis TaxID=3153754 RepID=UPI0032631996
MTDQQARPAAAGERGASAATSSEGPRPHLAAPAFEVAGSRFTAGIYDAFLTLGEHRGMRATRRGLLAGARGRVLEIGAGTGLNLSHYPEAIDELVLGEPSAPMADRLEARRARLGRRAHIVAAPAEALPFGDGSFDTVVSTLVLCTVRDPDAALAEVRRVLRPGGRLLFCEHVRSDSPRLSRWQDRLADAWAAVADGCRCNRETLDTISSHMRITTVDRLIWRGMPHLVHPVIVGEAVV